MNLYLIHLPYFFRGGDWAIEIALKSHLAATVEPLSLSLSLSPSLSLSLSLSLFSSLLFSGTAATAVNYICEPDKTVS
jgi:hypothetical protein